MDSTKLKVLLSVAIIVTGSLVTLAAGTGTVASGYQTNGVAIDFGERKVVWTDVDFGIHGDAKGALEYCCEHNGYPLSFKQDGTVESINGFVSGSDSVWNLWAVEHGKTDWVKLSPPYSMSPSDYSVTSWAYRTPGKTPTVAVDQTGRCIYGYSQAYRTVSLSPSITEIIGAIGASKTLVGTDKYSNYPEEVISRKERGDIRIVGDYTSPSYEEIIKTQPDVVLCDGSQYNHIQVADRLRKHSIVAIVLHSGESYEAIMDNIYIVGVVFGYDIAANVIIDDISSAHNAITTAAGSIPQINSNDVMVSLSPDMSPWVSGSHTYAHDVLTEALGKNIFASNIGWAHINSELILKSNPSVIIILTVDYRATQGEYDTMMASLSAEWKGTDAYKDGEIYLICEGAGEMAQRPGPRVAHLFELFARILNKDAFGDITMPKFIGDDYRDYLTYTKLTVE